MCMWLLMLHMYKVPGTQALIMSVARCRHQEVNSDTSAHNEQPIASKPWPQSELTLLVTILLSMKELHVFNK